ncbi:hypothetical protein BD779DRAFT_496383 [Infundibulicybe gibba]|nr:hypothetical protein BD779DRAFT_496383 [Infundibulicybe gibba]
MINRIPSAIQPAAPHNFFVFWKRRRSKPPVIGDLQYGPNLSRQPFSTSCKCSTQKHLRSIFIGLSKAFDSRIVCHNRGILQPRHIWAHRMLRHFAHSPQQGGSEEHRRQISLVGVELLFADRGVLRGFFFWVIQTRPNHGSHPQRKGTGPGSDAQNFVLLDPLRIEHAV